jgi:hypothetical protein
MFRKYLIGSGGLIGCGLWYGMTNIPKPSYWDNINLDLKQVNNDDDLYHNIFNYGEQLGVKNSKEIIKSNFEELKILNLLPITVFYRGDIFTSSNRFDYLLTMNMINKYNQKNIINFSDKIQIYIKWGGLKGLAVGHSSMISYILINYGLTNTSYGAIFLLICEICRYYKLMNYIQDEQDYRLLKLNNFVQCNFIYDCVIETLTYIDCYSCLEETKTKIDYYCDNRLIDNLESKLKHSKQARCLCKDHDNLYRRIFALNHPFFTWDAKA